MHDHAVFVCLDDKHKVKVGEPGSPVAAVECGRQAIVPAQARLQASDHDFTKFGIIPSGNTKRTAGSVKHKGSLSLKDRLIDEDHVYQAWVLNS